MKSLKLLFLVGFSLIGSLAEVTASVNEPGCLNSFTISKGGFQINLKRKENATMEINCYGDDFARFPEININCNAVGSTKFVNCSNSENHSILDIFHKMNINSSGEIVFKYLISPPNRQYFKDISVNHLKFSSSDLNNLPFDTLYDVSDLRNLTIHHSNLVRLPVNFFKKGATQLISLDIMMTKLSTITKGDLAELTELQTLILYENAITEIEAGAFDNLSKLKTLEISHNRLRVLAPGSFRNLVNLERVHMGRNPFDELPSDLFTSISNCHLVAFRLNSAHGSLRRLPDGFFKNLTYLTEVGMQGSQLESLSADMFAETSELVKLNLRNNTLKTLPLELFKSFKKLQTLDLARNQIQELPDGIFEQLISLKELDISYNNLTTLNSAILKGLSALIKFNASHNQLSNVQDDFCRSMGSMEDVDFSFNQLNFQANTRFVHLKNPSIFMHCPEKIRKAYLSNNQATKIFDEYASMSFVDLKNNSLSELTARDIMNLNPVGTFDLRNNPISKINLTELPSVVANYKKLNKHIQHRKLKVMLGYNSLHCDCHLIDFFRYWKSDHDSELRQYVKLSATSNSMICVSPAEFKNRDISSISIEELSCPLKSNIAKDACSNACTCREYPAKQILSVDCSHKNFSKLPSSIANVHNWSIELDMSYNKFSQTPSLNSSYLVNVTSLDLSSNNISTVTIDVFSPKLYQLKLHNNSISRLDQQIIDYMNSDKVLRKLTLHGNPWECDCQARSFQELVQKKLKSRDLHEIVCHGSGRALTTMTVSELCQAQTALIVVGSVLLGLFALVIGISLALYYKYQQEIKIWLYSKQCCLWFVTEDELDKDKKYDAFVSFSHKDEDFVEKEIVAQLEDGPTPYKLCLHYRDWLAGEWIPVQISQSVEQSRRTIVVLSPNFLESVWGRMEFRTAHTQALKEGRARVIIILYGDIENMDDLDPELKAYLSLNTYIKWGDPWFWDKLRYALPHRFEPSRRRTRNAPILEDHLMRQTVNNESNAIVKSEVITMSTLTNDSAKLLNDQTTASC